MWCDTISGYCEAHHKSIIDVSGDAESELFHNKTISRKLKPIDIRAVLDFMVDQGLGKWQDDKKAKCVVTWKSFDEWAAAIYEWATKSGHVNSGICTVYEITDDDATRSESFHKLDKGVVLEALHVLQSQERCQLYEGSSIDEMGVKFTSR
jgi:ESCRT-II complex subunit VPS25